MISSPLRFRPKPPPVQPPTVSCLNCGSEVSTNFCPQCGQENEPLRLGIGPILRDALSEFTQFDSKLFATVKTLFIRPGLLSQEWARGRRIGYISPLKLYLTATFVFFLVATWNINRNADKIERSSGSVVHFSGGKSKPTDNYFVHHMRKLEGAKPKEIVDVVLDKMPHALFLLLPAFAFLLKLCYIRRSRYYVEHLVFSLHNHSFHFFVLAITTPLSLPNVEGLAFLACIAYFILALKRYYNQSWPKTLLKGSMLGCGYMFLLIPTLFAALFFGLVGMPEKKSDPEKPAPSVSKSERAKTK